MSKRFKSHRHTAMSAAKKFRVTFLPPVNNKPAQISIRPTPILTSPFTPWTNPQVDELICSLDAINFSSEDILYRLKSEFPVLRFRVITKEMLERRIACLDQQSDVKHFKKGLLFSKERVDAEKRELARAKQQTVVLVEDEESTPVAYKSPKPQPNESFTASCDTANQYLQGQSNTSRNELAEQADTSDAESTNTSHTEITTRGTRHGLCIHQRGPSCQSTATTLNPTSTFTAAGDKAAFVLSRSSRGVRHGQAIQRTAASYKRAPSNDPRTGAFAGPLSSSASTARYSMGARHGQAIHGVSRQAPLRDISNCNNTNNASAGTSPMERGPLRVVNVSDDENLDPNEEDIPPSAPGSASKAWLEPDHRNIQTSVSASALSSKPLVFKKRERTPQEVTARMRIRDSLEVAKAKEKAKTKDNVKGHGALNERLNEVDA